MNRKKWSDAEMEKLRTLYPDTPPRKLEEIFGRSIRAIYGKAYAMGLKRSQAYLDSPLSGRTMKGSSRGSKTQFKKGLVPWNAGKKGWQAGGDSAKHHFKPGQRPHNWRPIGFERISKDGYLERKITDTGHTGKDFCFVHRLIWEEHHGPIPDGHVIVFKDTNPKHENITIDRLEMLSRAELADRNTIHRYPPELIATIRKLGRAKRTVRRKQREESKRSG